MCKLKHFSALHTYNLSINQILLVSITGVYLLVFCNLAIHHTFAAVFRDHTEKYSGACWSLPMSYFEQVLEE